MRPRSTPSATRSSTARRPTSSARCRCRRPCRGALVKADEQEMFAGRARRTRRTRASRSTSRSSRCRSSRPTRRSSAVMASAINFNTVWTSIFEPLPDVRVPEAARPRERVGHAPRPAVPRDRVATRAGVVLRVGSAVRNWKPGDAVTVHCLHVDDQDPSAHDDSMMATNQRIWGFETNFGGLAEIAVVKANQLMPKPAHLTWEEAACNALCNSTSYRMIVSPNGSQMTQGQAVLVWGATGGIGAYACQYVLNGGGTPVGVVSSREARRAAARDGLSRHVIDRRGRGLQVLERRRHRAGPGGVAAARQEDPRARRPRRRHRVRAPRPLDDGRVGVRRQARRHDHHVRGDVGLQDRVRQPLPLDEPEDAEGLPLRELPRGVGGEPAGVRGADPPDAVEGVPARPDRRGRVPGAPQPASRARSACCASRPKRASASPTRRRASSTSTRSRCSAASRTEQVDRHGHAAHRDRPRRHRRQRPRGRDRLLPRRRSAARSSTARSSSATASRRRC